MVRVSSSFEAVNPVEVNVEQLQERIDETEEDATEPVY